MPQISLQGHLYSYKLTRGFQTSLRLKATGRRSFSVSCPHLTPTNFIQKFILDHQIWITKNCQKFSKKIRLSTIKTVTILSISYKIVINKTARDSVIIDDNEHIIYTNTTTPSTSHLKKLYNLKFRPLALKLIKSELAILKSQFGFDYQKVSVKNQSSRFGSCSSRGNLSFNWQIIFFPPDLFRHILLHELTHLKIKNHSAVYWRQLSLYDPDAIAHNRLLKKEGTKYFLI
ncbi:MAG: YgjP-like metallopeptidase domain-containing protein [Candidatus Shapirobacteria bacterium]